jgi:RNA polymerase sigma-70 factor (ECF subfamily)
VTAPFGAALAEALPRLRRYAIALAGDVATADDLLQDCMERAWKNQAAITDERALFPWLRAILHNVNIDRIRLRRRRPNETETLDAIAETLAGSDAGDGATQSTDVIRSMNQLSFEHRQILLLVGVEGLSYREIAGELGIPVGTVMSRLARARERLRALLEEGR